MNKTLFKNLKQSLKEAVAIRRGDLAPGRVKRSKKTVLLGGLWRLKNENPK